MIEFINNFNFLFFVMFAILYTYQVVYTIFSIFKRAKKFKSNKFHSYAIVIPARNEEKVICQLIDSIKKQDYPNDLIRIYVIADNCTDETANVTRKAGAEVYERFNDTLVGKGYALKEFFTWLDKSGKLDDSEGYILFDADNLLERNYMKEINNLFDNGYSIVTGYRNPKNFSDSWVAAGSGTWFLRDCVFMNRPRMMLNTTSNVTGTGFVMSTRILRKAELWKYHLLTEDIEFSVDMVLSGETIGYAEDAVFYDEQPKRFKESWVQRKRWVKGFYQVLSKYGRKLAMGAFVKGDYGVFDMFMLVAPGNALTLISIGVNFIFFLIGLSDPKMQIEVIKATAGSILSLLINFFIIFFIVGGCTIIKEWKRIKADNIKKVVSIFTFPVYMLTYIPISILAAFIKVQWVPIEHSQAKNISDMK